MKQTANRKSKVNLLPEEIRQTLNAFIRNGSMTQKDILAEINQMIDEAGLPEDVKLSRTGFNRYAKKMEEMGMRMRQAREVAEVWTAKLGDAPVSDVGKLLQEFVRTMAFETSMRMMEEAEENQEVIPPKALNQLALVSQRIEQAAMTSQKVEREIRAAFAAEAADKAEKIVKQAGLTAATAEEIKRQILGIAS
ncbi:DUF3486 family protein [Vibrio gazogenes]|uniref:Mu-like prophage FluMu protein gp27 n=1 Tax=Vibrio gazogenes DSM 21264 = NBRC 103151 TaxID=1123492 RepID=A0A1M5F8R3_VIBGA|nr:DUF3486 family protein [Vibrio gazogenes]USP15458.1 DUF3486 family protein [Vibrio gazogenes]SHF87973.1 Protein of unknown function [Vibrio gazogenes DSM 21264] [Vibrio gazogenes DSM 21264 = NBRC 103151]SJN54531.1 hypothetical protein BQ6471_01060 [Vibrio gazogenes]